jgi:hypothetical protein
MLIRIDLVFSYWVFAWYLAYMAKLTPYNPKWGLVLGIMENALMLIAFIAFGATFSTIALFILINIAIKGIPLYTIYNTKTCIKDIYALIGLFALYTIWVYANGGTVAEYAQKTFDSILHGKNETPAMWLIAKLRAYI